MQSTRESSINKFGQEEIQSNKIKIFVFNNNYFYYCCNLILIISMNELVNNFELKIIPL